MFQNFIGLMEGRKEIQRKSHRPFAFPPISVKILVCLAFADDEQSARVGNGNVQAKRRGPEEDEESREDVA